ncbi:MAG: hypothetical protein M0R46_07440 [Candidatus Muirbacterium halophilum]|nr:hypothetical protein [Candidatus Muirbacterium halophilum]MCK9475733.1 hypothetical protein [Candidatus Muirbacterium halophilum]
MNKVTKVLLIILLTALFVFGGEANEIFLKNIEIINDENNSQIIIEFDNIVNNFSNTIKGNNLVIDIPDSYLSMLDIPIKSTISDINIIQPMQLKKTPPVTRVICVWKNLKEHTVEAKNNKIVILLKGNQTKEENIEDILIKELGHDRRLDECIECNDDEHDYVESIKNENTNYNVQKTVSKPDNSFKTENINFNFSGMSLREIFETLSNLTGLNIIIDGEVKERNLNLYIQELPVNEALDLVVASSGLAMNRFNENTWIISEKDKSREIHQKKNQSIFRLVNAEADKVLELISSNTVLSQKIKIENLSIDKRINAILAYDTQENLRLLEKIISDFDKKNGQVTIELHIVEMKREDLNNFGLSFDQFPLTPQSIDVLNIPSNISIYSKLEALESQEKANILSSPKIRVVHRKTAKIEIGDEIPVPYYTYEEAHKYVTEGAINNLRVIEPLKKFEKANVGITLEVTPYIHDNSEVSMDLNIDVSDLLKIDNDGQLYTSTRNTTTFVRLKDRETAVLGGLIKQEERNEDSRIPGFQRIPILRSLFKNKRVSKKNMEMLMFITPYFVNGENNEEYTVSKNSNLNKKDNSNNLKKVDNEYYNVIGDLRKVSQ